MATYVQIDVCCNIDEGSGYAYIGQYKAYFSGKNYKRSSKVWEIGDVLTVVANPVPGYTCVTKTLTVRYAYQPFEVKYEKNSTPTPTYYPAKITCNISAGSGDVWAYGGGKEWRQSWSGTSTTTPKNWYESGDTMYVSANPVSGYEAPAQATYTFVPNKAYDVKYTKIITYTLTYTKYSDNTGDPPGAQTFRPNVDSVTIQGKNTLAKSISTDLSYKITFNPNGGSTSKTSETCTRKRTTSYKFEGWTATQNGTEVQYTAGKSYTFGQGNKTLYPVWAVSGTSEAANTGVKVPTAAECTRTGYKLLGFRVANSSTVNYTPGASTGKDFSSDTTLYAVWERIYHNVYFVRDTTETYDSTIATRPSVYATVASGNVFQLPNNGHVTKPAETLGSYSIEFKPANGGSSIYRDYSTIKSYVQDGWAYENTTTTVAAGAAVVIWEETKFVAWWTSRTNNTKIKTPAAPTRTGYAFKGWLLDGTSQLYGAETNYTPGEISGVAANTSFTAQWEAVFNLTVVRDNICNVSVSYGSQSSSSGGETSSASLSITAKSSPVFNISAFGGMGAAYDFDYWDYDTSLSAVDFGNANSKETTARIASAKAGQFIAHVYAHTKKIAYFKIKLGEHVKSCKITYTSYWENAQVTVTQTASEITYYAVEGTAFSIDKSNITADYGYIATSGFDGYPDYTDNTLKNVKTVTVSKAARYSLSALTNANGTFKGDIAITSDDGATARTYGTTETITLAEQVSNKFKIQALVNNSNYYFSHWARSAGADFTYIDSTKNTDRDARIQITGTNAGTVYGLAMQANFNAWPSVKIGCRVADSSGNPVLNGQYGVGDVKISYTNGSSYASNGSYIGDSKYEIKGYDIAGRGWVTRPGEYLSLQAIPAAGYEFSKWILFGSQEDTFVTQSINFQVPFVSCVLYAIFKPVKREVRISSNSNIVYNKPGKFYINKGAFDSSLVSYATSVEILNNVDTFTLVAPVDPATGYEFDGWYTGSGIKIQHYVSSGLAYVMLTPGDAQYSFSSFVAKYSLKEYTLATHVRAETLGTTATGTISPSYPDGTTVTYGQKIIFDATPALTPRSKFSKWVLQRSFDNSEQELSTESNFTYIHNYTFNTTLVAVFDLARILTAHAYVSGGGTISITHKSGSETNTYNNQTDKKFQFFENDAIILSAKPQTGYKFLYWRYSGPDGRLKETTDSVLNLTPDYLSSMEVNLTCIAYFEEISYSFYFKQQGGDDKCTTAIKIGLDVYTPQAKPITFTSSSISGQIVRLVSQVSEGSEYVFKEWRITNSVGKTFVVTSNVYDIEDLSSYGETFTILAVYLKASQGNLTVRVVSGSRIPFNPASGPETYPSWAGITALEWYNTGDNYLYYSSPSESSPGIFGECTWYVNGRTAQLRGGVEGSWAPYGNKGSFPDANQWPSSCTGNWFVSDTPQVGSVAVFNKYSNTEWGHVGVVEQINDDGTLVISQFNGGPSSIYYHCSLEPETKASPNGFIFISNTTNPVIGLSSSNTNNSTTDEELSTSPGSSIGAGGEAWIEFNSQQYQVVSTYFTGDTCTLVALPNSGYAFDYWQAPNGNIIHGEENSTYSFMVTEDTAGTYLAYFRRTETGPGGEAPEPPYDPEDPIEYKYYAYSAVQSYIQQRGQAYWNYKKNKWLIGYGPYLTSKFIELDYVESNKASQQWLSIGWKPSPLTILEFTGQFTDITGDQVVGSRQCGVHVQDGSMWFECGSSTQPIEFDTNIHTFKINCGTGECYLDNVLYTCKKLDRVAKGPIKLFGLDNEDFAGNKVALDPYSSSFKLYSAKVWDINPNSQNMLVRDLVPVRRWHRPDEEATHIGLWDRVFNRFYQSNAYMTIDGEYTQIKLIAGPDKLENGKPKVLEKTYR